MPPKMNRPLFTGPYRHQNWSLPNSIIYNMAKNPSTSKVYQKIIQSCKYFFIKHPIIVLTCLHYTEDGWKTCPFTKKCNDKENEMCKINLKNIESKLWILDTFDVCQHTTLIPPSVISKIYKCQAENCYLLQQSITLNELLFLASKAVFCILIESTVKDDRDGSPIQLETIVESLPKLQKLGITFISYATNISSKTVQELLKLPPFSNIKRLSLYNLPESFDLDTLFKYYEGTKDMLLNLDFCDSISDAFKNYLNELVDKILETPSLTYRTPYLTFAGQNGEKNVILFERFLNDNRNYNC